MDAKKAVRKHEENMHPSAKPTKLRAGGKTNSDMLKTVSYTHLTLPTKRIV